MAVRQVTRRYQGLAHFLGEWESTLKMGALAVGPGEVEGELAAEVKVDLVLPLVGRVGPIPAQVVHRGPDGSAGLQIPEMPPKAKASIDQVFAFMDEVRAHLLATGQVVLPGAEKARAPVSQVPRAEAAPQRPPEPRPEAAPSAPVRAPAAAPGESMALPDLADREPDLSGLLGDRSLRDTMVRLAVERRSGLLMILEANDRRRFGFWQRGGPVGWRAEPIDELEVLGVLLFKAGRITREQLAESLRVMEREGVRQGEALMQMGILTFPQLVMVLQKQVEYVLQRVMRLGEGVWAFFEMAELPEKFIAPPLRVPSLLFRALKNYTQELASETISAVHRPNLDRYIFFAEGVERVLDEIAFTPAEKKFLEITRSNSWRLRELFSVSNLSRSETANTLWALNEMNFMDYREEETRDRYLTRVGNRIMSKNSQCKAGTHFDVMEVHWICLPAEVETAYKRLKGEFDPARFKDLTPEMREAVTRINQKVEESYQILRNETERRAHREAVVEKDKISQSAEILARKGEMAIMKADRAEATTCFGKALELMPKNNDYREGLERSRLLQG